MCAETGNLREFESLACVGTDKYVLEMQSRERVSVIEKSACRNFSHRHWCAVSCGKRFHFRLRAKTLLHWHVGVCMHIGRCEKVKMADWTGDSHMGCEGIIASSYQYGDGVLVGSSLHHVASVLGPLRVPADIGNCECLLTEQCSHSDLGALVLVQTLFLFLAVKHLTMEGKKKPKKRRMAKMSRKRSLFWLLWCVLIVLLSTPAILFQVVKSIPGSLQSGTILLFGLRAAIGAIQGLVGNFIVPYLASRTTWQKHVFTAVSNLFMSCLIPAVVIIYLDTGCLARWVTLWKPCRSNSQLLQRSLICTRVKFEDCEDMGLDPFAGISITVLHSSDVCEPRFSWSSTSISRCIHTSLLRLQEIWLPKFITMGLLMPGLSLLGGRLPTESGAIVGNFGIYMAYALVSSGHLPLMNFILLLAFLGEGLVARVAWVESRLKAKYVENVAAPVVKIARLLSLMVQVSSVAGDPRMLVIASACIFTLIIAQRTAYVRPPARLKVTKSEVE